MFSPDRVFSGVHSPSSGAFISSLVETVHDCIFRRDLFPIRVDYPNPSLSPTEGRVSVVNAICSVAISHNRSLCSLSLWGPRFTFLVFTLWRSSVSTSNAVESLF